jgi:DNA polymerase III epsilon subunit-like protein
MASSSVTPHPIIVSDDFLFVLSVKFRLSFPQLLTFVDSIANKDIEFLVFDTETTGLPVRDNYQTCRLVQIAFEAYSPNGVLLDSKCVLVKPFGFSIPQEATNIHGITQEQALLSGVEQKEVLDIFMSYLARSKILVAHNIEFDVNVITNELRLLDRTNDINDLRYVPKICTYLGYPITISEKSRKLKDRYKDCFGEFPVDEHKADADTRSCARVFFWKEKHLKIQ